MLLLRTRATAFKSQVKVLNSTTKEELELEIARPSKTVSKDGFSSYDVNLSAIKAKKPEFTQTLAKKSTLWDDGKSKITKRCRGKKSAADTST